MIEPYNAVGLIPSFWGIRRREEIKHNIEHLKGLTKAAFWLSNLDIPVRLLAIPEGALMGFNDEVLDVDHADYARTCCIDVPGPEGVSNVLFAGPGLKWLYVMEWNKVYRRPVRRSGIDPFRKTPRPRR